MTSAYISSVHDCHQYVIQKKSSYYYHDVIQKNCFYHYNVVQKDSSSSHGVINKKNSSYYNDVCFQTNNSNDHDFIKKNSSYYHDVIQQNSSLTTITEGAKHGIKAIVCNFLKYTRHRGILLYSFQLILKNQICPSCTKTIK